MMKVDEINILINKTIMKRREIGYHEHNYVPINSTSAVSKYEQALRMLLS